MNHSNIYQLDQKLELYEKNYIKDRFNLYNSKIDKVINIIKSISTIFISFLLLIYSEFFIRNPLLQAILLFFAFFIVTVLIGYCECLYNIYKNKKENLYNYIRDNDLLQITNEIFTEYSYTNPNNYLPKKTLSFFTFTNALFFLYIYTVLSEFSSELFFKLILSNFIYTLIITYQISAVIFCIFYPRILSFIKNHNHIIIKSTSFFGIIFLAVTYFLSFSYQNSFHAKINLTTGKTLQYEEIICTMNTKFNRSILTLKVTLKDKNSENITQDDFAKTIMSIAQEYYQRYNCDITRVFILCQNTGNNLADQLLATVDYIPDRIGYNGKKINNEWVRLLVAKRGFSLKELEFLQVYGKNLAQTKT